MYVCVGACVVRVCMCAYFGARVCECVYGFVCMGSCVCAGGCV